uniref:2-dehydropantolactone reductase n=1 Tax=Lodderomyces elongisporus TaxID=36914 RepID=I1V8K1_9ASCO|nr:NADPH dependent aldo-ketoreductase [Lodderomyces elongisporus]
MSSQLSINTKTYTLNNGLKIPAIGLGTWLADEEDAAYKATLTALKNGYKHIDTAAAYGNEDQVGRAIADSGVSRDEIFVTTKLWNDQHKDPEGALDESLKKLGLEYVDLYLIHWPLSVDPKTEKPYDDYDFVDTWRNLQKIYKEGKKVKAIGVSNFNKKKLDKLLNSEGVNVVPVINQIEAHPLLTQPDLFDYLKSKDIYITAYSPLGHADASTLKNKVVTDIAKKHDANAGQVLISWGVQRGTIVIPKSTTDERIIDNIKTFTLSQEDFDALNNLEKEEGEKRTNDPDFFDFNA